MRVRDLRPGMVYTPLIPEMSSLIFITQSRHPLWPGLQLVVWRDADTDKVAFDALDGSLVLDGVIAEHDGETRLAWLRRGVLGRQGAEDMIAAVQQVLKANPRPPITQALLDDYRRNPTLPQRPPRHGPVLSTLLALGQVPRALNGTDAVPLKDEAGIAQEQVNHPEDKE
jgi:hypothetical protein